MRKSNDIISSLALKRMCYILLRTWTEWWLNIGRHIKLTPSPQHLKQEKGKSRESGKRKRGKEEAHSFRKQKKKRMPYFPFPGRSPPCRGLWVGHIWHSPTGNSWLWNPTFVYLKDRQGMLARDLCMANCFAYWRPGDCLGLPHLWVNELTTVL